MQNLTKLFRLLEITRAHPQYGYTLAEIPKGEISDLAQHHYLVAFIAWQLVRLVKRAGGSIDGEKVLEFALIHDLGELFGGDISMPYAKANPAAREAAKKFERENQKYMARFFGDDAEYFDALSEEILDAKSDEALVAKIADYIECTHYKLYVRRFSKGDVTMVQKKMLEMIEKVQDEQARQVLGGFVSMWATDLVTGQLEELFEEVKHD